MDLQDRLDALRVRLRSALSEDERSAVEGAVERLRMMQIVEHGLVVGDVLPDFALPDLARRIVTSEELLAHGPLVVTFIRGTWCPYCSLTLQALDEAAPDIRAAGGELVTISPMRRETLAEAAEERGLRLPMLSDLGNAYARLCGVRYEMSDGQVALYRRRDVDVAAANGTAEWEVPVPATYVAGRDGVILYTFADADWSRRASFAQILEAVRRASQAAEAVTAG